MNNMDNFASRLLAWAAWGCRWRRCQVAAADIVAEKINRRVSLIRDEYLERGIDADGNPVRLNLTATTDGAAAYADADFVIVANRRSKELDDVKDEAYTRDVFGEN